MILLQLKFSKRCAMLAFIKDWASELSFQHQNYCESRYRNFKHNTQHVMCCLNDPANCWLLCLEYVVFVMNHSTVESRNGILPSKDLPSRLLIFVLSCNSFISGKDAYFTDYKASVSHGMLAF